PTTWIAPHCRFIILITTDRTVSVFLAVTRPVDMTSWTSMATSVLVSEIGNTSPPGNHRVRSARETPRAAIKARRKGGPLWCPWWALGTPTTIYMVVIPERPARYRGP